MPEALFVEVILVTHVFSWVELMLACLVRPSRMTFEAYD